ncbi:MAG: hypothetical protein ABEJ56_06310 [Candidatus Nanohaloarchaea archaeon]
MERTKEGAKKYFSELLRREDELRASALAEAETRSQAWDEFSELMEDASLLLTRDGERADVEDVNWRAIEDDRVEYGVETGNEETVYYVRKEKIGNL